MEQCCGNWTPDGNYFVFESDQGFNEITPLGDSGKKWISPQAQP